jgi:cell division protein FtsX
MKRILSLTVLLFVSLSLPAQEAEMADNMRAEGKIYVVVAILVTILAGLIAFVLALDRKATRVEKKADELLKK